MFLAFFFNDTFYPAKTALQFRLLPPVFIFFFPIDKACPLIRSISAAASPFHLEP